MKADDSRAHQDEMGGGINTMINSVQKETLPSTTDRLGTPFSAYIRLLNSIGLAWLSLQTKNDECLNHDS